MAKRYAGLKAFGSKAVSVVASGALALSLTPAIALADPGEVAGLQVQAANLSTQHYEYNHATGRAVIGDYGDPLNNGIEVSKAWDGTSIQYKGFAHSDDGKHYQGYSLYTKITTDDDGTLMAIDITSGDDTYAGVWGYSPKYGKSKTFVNGFLPDGVDFTANENSDGTYTPVLTGWEKYNKAVPVPAVTLMSVNADGNADSSGNGSKIVEETYTGSVAKIDTARSAAKDEGDKGAAATDGGYYNLVRCRYEIGSEKTTFDTYFSVGEKKDIADQYIDNCIPDTRWEQAAASTTNREGWTGIMGTMTLRMLQSWGATMGDFSKASEDGINGEIGAIDTVSGATKTATPFAAALNQARADGHIKAVSENVKLTIDGERVGEETMPALSVNKSAGGADNFQDVVTVTRNSGGKYVVEGAFKPYGGGRLSLDAVSMYNLQGVDVGTQGIMTLSKTLPDKDNPFNEYKTWQQVAPDATDRQGNTTTFWDEDSENHIIAFGNRTVTESDGSRRFQANVYPATPDKKADTDKAAITVGEGDVDPDNRIDAKFIKEDDSTIQYQITVNDDDVTHLAMTYTLGHGRITSVYDLAEQLKVADTSAALAAANADDASTVATARAAYDATPYDVRPFTTGIANLHAQEAKLVADQLNGVSASDEAAVAAARAAYDKLDAAAKAQVESAAVAQLANAEKASADAKAAAEASNRQAAGSGTGQDNAQDASASAAESASTAVNVGDAATVSGQTYKVTKVATASAQGTVTFTKAKNAKSVTVPASVTLVDGLKYKVTQVAASSFTASKIRSVTIGTNVAKIAPKAFAKSKATKAIVKTASLTKAAVKNCFKGAKVATVKVPAKKLAAYKKAFTKKNTGSTKALKVAK